jgi:tetratricopeptide (TPR) repeat protein
MEVQLRESFLEIPAQWRTVELENEYLLMVVLPDMGGRVARLYDKIAGRDVFLPVSEARPGMPARAAGGMEFIFPADRPPTAMDPVNCLTRRYPDGSASVVFGAIERMTFMNWKVELRLYPGLAYVEENVELANPTDGFHTFCWWSSAAVPREPGMRMCCPFDWRTTAAGYGKWPMDGAIDSSLPEAVPGRYETSGKLVMRDFFGVYYPGSDYGVARSAARKRAKGAKFLLRGGAEYVELQSGPFESPGVSRHMCPHQMLSWKEHWFGVRGIGPFAQASRDAALAVERNAAGVVLKFSANGTFEGCAVRLTHDGETRECRVSLYPESPQAVEFDGVGVEESLAVDVFCRGRLLLSVGHGAGPAQDMPDFDLFEDARAAGPDGGYLEAHPESAAALVRTGRVLLAQRKPDEAAECFARALRADNQDGAARFGLAAALNGAGDAEQARRLYYDIPMGDPFFEASVLEAAALNIRLGDPFDTISLLEGCAHPWGRFLLAVSQRLLGIPDAGAGDPGSLDEFFLAEQHLSGGGGAGLSAFTGAREEQLVCIASVYAALGLGDDCLSILSLAADPGMKTALFKALYGRMTLSEALSLPMEGVFVNEPPLLDLLEACEDGTGKAAWLLGCFRYSAGLEDAALENWLEAYAGGLRHTALLFSLAQACALRGRYDEAVRYLREDLSLQTPANAETLALLCGLLKKRGDTLGRLELLPALREAENAPLAAAAIAEALLDGGLPEDALRFMEAARFPNGADCGEAGRLWSAAVGALALRRAREGCADEARALAGRIFAYPDGLQCGREAGRSRAEHFWALGQVHRLTGDAEKALEAFREGAREGGISSIAADEEAMRWVNLCQEELNRI